MYKFQRPIIGIQNNNTDSCYLNSVIQILLCIKPLNSFILKTNSFSNQIHGKFIRKYRDILSILSEHSEEFQIDNENIINSDILKNILGKIKCIYVSGQQDAHETFVDILNIMHEGFNKVILSDTITIASKPNDTPNDKLRFLSEKSWYDSIKTNNYSIINSLFDGQLRCQITCKTCLTQFNKFEYFNHISIPLGESDSAPKCIYECIDKFLGIEYLRDIDSYYCKRCCCKVEAKKITSIWKHPKYLILHLNRFSVETDSSVTNSKCIKNLTSVSYPVNSLVLTNEQSSVSYNLFGIIEHHGVSMECGHYTSYINVNNKFIHLDDEDIQENCSIPDSPYILFYELPDSVF